MRIRRSVAVRPSAAAQQLQLEFGFTAPRRAVSEIVAELPRDERWTIGAIVGPSGSGKTTVAAARWGIQPRRRWRADRVLLDEFPSSVPLGEIAGVFTAVGLGSVPCWSRPYHTLSTGEQFRADLAAALLGRHDPVVIDEFSAALDRPTAQLAAAATAKALRNRYSPLFGRRLVAVTAHDDVLDWLEPDWVVRFPGGELSRRLLRRPQLELQIVRAAQADWPRFAPHHYLTGTIPRDAFGYLAIHDRQPIAIALYSQVMRAIGRKRCARLVVLPSYQGLGIGVRLLNTSADLLSAIHREISITTGHPAMIAFLRRSPDWRIYSDKPYGHHRWSGGAHVGNVGSSAGRHVVSALWLR